METVPLIDDLRQAMLDEEATRRASGIMFPWEVDGHVEAQFAEAEDQEFDALVKESQRLLAQATAKHFAVLAEAKKRRSHASRGYRSQATWVSSLIRLSKSQCGGRVARAEFLTGRLPEIFGALLAGEITSEHADLIARTGLLHPDQAVESQHYFLLWAQESWPMFKTFMMNWAEIVDDTDPQELVDRAHRDRRMAWAQGVGHTMLVELSIPNECFEPMLDAMQPIYDRMEKQEWLEARAALGEAATFKDLARTSSQRWLDALLELVRRGAASGTIDPGIKAILNVIIDNATLQRELARFEDHGAEPARPDHHDVETYRCQTLSGLPISPALAVRIAIAGAVRRFVMHADDLDFNATASTRLFTGAKRIGLVIRDRFCQGPGCDTPASRCEADHIHESSSGGLTMPENGQMLCPACHRHKTQLFTQGLARNN